MRSDLSDADVSFAGCGFMCIYHTGVCAALKEYAPQMVKNRISGASAGAIAAAALICNVCISEATSAILQVICEARSGYLQALSPTFDLLGLARDGMERILPENAHLLCSDRLHISLTRYDDCKNVTISKFLSKEDLIQAILCSCFIPVICGATVPMFHGVAYIDGGFSDNQPRFDERTITISPFSGESDICPMDNECAGFFDCNFHNTSFRFTTYNLFRLCSCFAPPSQDICSRFCRQGFTDTLRFLTKNAITPCVKCLTVQSNSMQLPVYGSQLNQNRFKKRLDSECEVCLEKMDTSQVDVETTTALFPEHMQKTLIGTKPKNNTLYKYVTSFQIIQWSARLFLPVIVTVDYWLLVVKVLQNWVKSTSKADFFWEHVQLVVDTILQEVEDRNLLTTPKFSYRQSLHNKSDKVKISKHEAELCDNDNKIQYMAAFNDVDSILRMIDYAENHNAILAYHYLDSSNNVQVCEIFDMNREIPRVNCHATKVNQIQQKRPDEQQILAVLPTKLANEMYLNDSLEKKKTIMTLKEEDEDLNELLIENSTKDGFSSLNKSESTLQLPQRSLKRRKTSILHDEIDFDSALHYVPPDPDDSSTRRTRDASCSTRRHTTIGVSTPALNASTRSNPVLLQQKKTSLLAFSSSKSLTSFSASSNAQSVQQPHFTNNFMSVNSNGKPDSRKIISISASSDSDVGDELFVVSNRRVVLADEYDGESDVTDHADSISSL